MKQISTIIKIVFILFVSFYIFLELNLWHRSWITIHDIFDALGFSFDVWKNSMTILGTKSSLFPLSKMCSEIVDKFSQFSILTSSLIRCQFSLSVKHLQHYKSAWHNSVIEGRRLEFASWRETEA